MHQSTAANESKYASEDQHQTKFKFCEMSFKILYASSTGHTEYIAEKLNELIPNSKLQDVDDLKDITELKNCKTLICCIPTWNTGADEARSGTSWDEKFEAIRSTDFSNTSVGIVGLGDSAAFSKYFCDAMEELHSSFSAAGANIIGQVSTEDYIYDDSKSIIDGMFCGLPIDEDNESEKTDDRLRNWAEQILETSQK